MKNIVLLVLVMLSTTYVFSQKEEEFDWERPLLNKKAPELKVKDWITEKPEMKGKFIVLDFWATFCGPCVQFTPKMNEFAKKFSKDAVFIAIGTQTVKQIKEGIKQIKEVKAKAGEPYVPIEFYQATDPEYELFNAFMLEGIPSVIVIDPQGIVRWMGNPHGDGEKKSELTAKVIASIIRKYK